MDSLVSHNPWVSAFFTAAAIVAVVFGWIKQGLPRLRAWQSKRREHEAIEQAKNAVLLGTPAIPFNPVTGAKAVPATPSIAVRLSDIGDRTTSVEATVKELLSQRRELDALASRVDGHDHEIADLKLARVERIVTKAESAAAWHAVEAVANSTPDTEAEEAED